MAVKPSGFIQMPRYLISLSGMSEVPEVEHRVCEGSTARDLCTNVAVKTV